jgi:osmoprotectant transport system permease protein
VIDETLAWFADPMHWVGPNGIPNRLTEHVAISAVSLLIAALIALPIGITIGHTGRGAVWAINSANLWRALPSLAVIAIVLPITAGIDPRAGFALYPTVVAMIVLGVPPILVNAYAGVQGVDRDLVDAGRGQGLAPAQVLRQVELPLAVPIIVTGIRSGAVQIVATATLGAIFGFGALGRYLVDGIAQQDTGQIFGGVLLVAGLVIATDILFAAIQRVLTPAALKLYREPRIANET